MLEEKWKKLSELKLFKVKKSLIFHIIDRIQVSRVPYIVNFALRFTYNYTTVSLTWSGTGISRVLVAYPFSGPNISSICNKKV